MTVATYLLLALGALGATDILLYHSIAHGIRHHPDARGELVTHALRGPTYAMLFLVVPNVALHGAWFWALVGVLAFDLALTVCDFALEGRSRSFLGGLPAGEYVLHVLIAIVFGAMVATVCFEGRVWTGLPTRLAWEPALVPVPLRALLAAMAGLVLMSGAQDAVAVHRLRGHPRRADGRLSQR